MADTTTTREAPRKRTVIFIIPSLYRAGAERVLHEVVSHLDKTLYGCHVICFFRQPNPFTFDPSVTISYLFPHPPFKVSEGFPKRFAKLINAMRISYRLATSLRRFPSDAVLIPFVECTTLHTALAQCFTKRPVIARPASTGMAFVRYAFHSDIRRRIEVLCLTADWGLADKIVVQSKGLKRDLVKKFSIPDRKIQRIPNPVNLGMIADMKKRPLNLDLSAFSGKPIFAHIGRLVDKKNHRLLLQACALLKHRGERFLVVCAGSGPMERRIIQLIRDFELDRHVIMVGNLSNPFALMAKARALLLTSSHESFSLVLIEAMASGTAVISVDCPYGPEDILEGGKFGLLVPLNDPGALADAMAKMIHDHRLFEEFKKRGRQRARDYNVHLIAKKWERLLEDTSDTGAWCRR